MRFGSLFSGIGGFDLGLERAGMRCAWQVEIDPFCRRVLAKHWPDVKRYEDVRNVGKHNLESVDLVCGGFPCQPHSVAGQRRGANDDRDLWPEMRRIVDELRPCWVLAENVVGVRTTILDAVLFELEGLGYTARAIVIPAAGVGAPHRRDRVWVVAHDDRGGLCQPGICQEQPRRAEVVGSGEAVAITGGAGLEIGRAKRKRPHATATPGGWWITEPDVGRVAYGVPNRMDRLRALGNAVVPQVVELIGRAIVGADS